MLSARFSPGYGRSTKADPTLLWPALSWAMDGSEPRPLERRRRVQLLAAVEKGWKENAVAH